MLIFQIRSYPVHIYIMTSILLNFSFYYCIHHKILQALPNVNLCVCALHKQFAYYAQCFCHPIINAQNYAGIMLVCS